MLNSPQPALILPSGCEAQLINPYDKETEYYEWYGFNSANEKIKTTKEYKHLAGKVVNVVEVWQRKPRPIKGMDKVFGWETTNPVAYTKYKDYSDFERWHDEKDFDTRRAFEVLSEEESKSEVENYPQKYDCLNCSWQSNSKPRHLKCPDCNTIVHVNTKSINTTNLSVEEAAEKEYPLCDPNTVSDATMRIHNKQMKELRISYIKGANYIINSGEYVKVSDVEKMLNVRVKHYADMEIKYPMLDNTIVENELQFLLWHYSNLKNNK